jgi:hypothetical protein
MPPSPSSAAVAHDSPSTFNIQRSISNVQCRGDEALIHLLFGTLDLIVAPATALFVYEAKNAAMLGKVRAAKAGAS